MGATIGRSFAAFLMTLLLCTTAAAQPDLPPPFPRQNATKLLETDRIVVWDIVWPNNQPTALHRHVYDQVGTYYARGGRTITTPDGTARQATTEIGALSTTRKGTTHVEMGNTESPLRAVFIELKHDDASGILSAQNDISPTLPPQDARQAYDEPRVRVWDTTAMPGEDRSYRARNDTVVVYLSAGRLRITGDDGKAQELTVGPGSMRYVARRTAERVTLLEGTPRAMIFELK